MFFVSYLVPERKLINMPFFVFQKGNISKSAGIPTASPFYNCKGGLRGIFLMQRG